MNGAQPRNNRSAAGAREATFATYSRAERLAEYRRFLERKVEMSPRLGFEVDESEIRPLKRGAWKPHQKVAVCWAVRGGRRALFESFGLGKTLQQLEILRIIIAKAGGRGLVVAPLGVRQEFIQHAALLDMRVKFIQSPDGLEPESPDLAYITNYETIREGKLDPALFTVTTLDEAAILRGLGGTKTFREFMRLFEGVRYRFVATATPDPNEYIELLAYAAYLGVMDVGQAKTRFFKRDSTKADKLTIHPHKEEEFWMWMSGWALFLTRPSELGFPDDGYVLPPLDIVYHEVKSDRIVTVADKDGQMRILPNSAMGVTQSAHEKRNSMPDRLAQAKQIIDDSPADHFILWHDLEDERRSIEQLIPGLKCVYGNQNRETNEQLLAAFAQGEIQYIGLKPEMSGCGGNYQRHCNKAIFCGIGFKFASFIQAVHRLQRFGQQYPVEVHLIYSEWERDILQNLLEKWERHKKQAEKMSTIITEYGLSEIAIAQALSRSIGCERVEVSGPDYILVNNDSVVEHLEDETAHIEDDSIGLILTSIPFSTQYEYTPSYNDFGHSADNEQFFAQMDFLTPELMRVLMPGRIAAIHVKDRIVPGGINGVGIQSAYPFHCDVTYHFMRHGFVYLGMKTITTDVVRENNQTYRLGWSEQCKDATKMGVGMPEYLLLFRKPQTDRTRGYADIPVKKSKQRYSRARWQIDAHGFTRSNGNRSLTPEEIVNLPHEKIFKMFDEYCLKHVYDFEHHVQLGERLERWSAERGLCQCKPEICKHGRLPVTFMLLQPPSVHPDVWTDITRMMTINALQARKGKQMHLCPMQFDIADRVITQMSNEGDVVLDPFSGLGTVVMRAITLKRKGIGIELNPGYFTDAVSYCEAASRKMATPGLFDAISDELEAACPN